MLHQTFLFLGQLWQLFEVSQILEFLRYLDFKLQTYYPIFDRYFAFKVIIFHMKGFWSDIPVILFSYFHRNL